MKLVQPKKTCSPLRLATFILLCWLCTTPVAGGSYGSSKDLHENYLEQLKSTSRSLDNIQIDFKGLVEVYCGICTFMIIKLPIFNEFCTVCETDKNALVDGLTDLTDQGSGYYRNGKISYRQDDSIENTTDLRFGFPGLESIKYMLIHVIDFFCSNVCKFSFNIILSQVCNICTFIDQFKKVLNGESRSSDSAKLSGRTDYQDYDSNLSTAYRSIPTLQTSLKEDTAQYDMDTLCSFCKFSSNEIFPEICDLCEQDPLKDPFENELTDIANDESTSIDSADANVRRVGDKLHDDVGGDGNAGISERKRRPYIKVVRNTRTPALYYPKLIGPITVRGPSKTYGSAGGDNAYKFKDGLGLKTGKVSGVYKTLGQLCGRAQ